MDILIRVGAIVVEIAILASIIYALLTGAQLTIFDLGLGYKYKRLLTLLLLIMGGLAIVFFIAHLTSFYPAL